MSFSNVGVNTNRTGLDCQGALRCPVQLAFYSRLSGFQNCAAASFLDVPSWTAFARPLHRPECRHWVDERPTRPGSHQPESRSGKPGIAKRRLAEMLTR